MWDGSAVPLDENLQIAQELLEKAAAAQIVLEIEVGVVGGEEDGVEGGVGRQALQHPRGRAGDRRGARHGREGPLPDGADLRQRARRLQARQRQAASRDPPARPAGGRRASSGSRAGSKPFDLVFHGGSGSLPEEIARGRRLRRGEDERRHRHPVRLHPSGRRATCSPTTTACSRSTGRSATRRPTTRAPGARPPRPGWRPGSSRPARTSGPRAPLSG